MAFIGNWLYEHVNHKVLLLPFCKPTCMFLSEAAKTTLPHSWHLFKARELHLFKGETQRMEAFIWARGVILWEMTLQTEVPKLRRPLLVDPEHSIPRTAEVLFSRDASGRRALVFGAFAEDALYYNTFVRPHQLFPFDHSAVLYCRTALIIQGDSVSSVE